MHFKMPLETAVAWLAYAVVSGQLFDVATGS